MMDQTPAPPPVLNSVRVLAYAVVDDTVEYTGRLLIVVEGERLGRVPRLVIGQDFGTDEVMLFHCNEAWNVLAAGAYSSLDAAKAAAEAGYRGLSANWVDLKVSAAEAREFMEREQAGFACSFCGRLPHEVRTLITGANGRICDSCIDKLHLAIHDHSADDSIT